MKKYLAPLIIFAAAVLLFFQNRLSAGMNDVNPLTNDLPWPTLAIVGGVALVAVIVLVVMSVLNKKRGGR